VVGTRKNSSHPASAAAAIASRNALGECTGADDASSRAKPSSKIFM